MNTIEAVVFDGDGVLVDSERINNEVFAELATTAGLPTTFQASVDRYSSMGSPHALRMACADHVITAMADAPRVLGVAAGVPPLLAGRAERGRVQERGSATDFGSADGRADAGAEPHV